MEEPKVFHFRSLRSASKALGVTYYFLYNAFHNLHENQFVSAYKIIKLDEDGNIMPPPQKPKFSEDGRANQNNGAHRAKGRHEGCKEEDGKERKEEPTKRKRGKEDRGQKRGKRKADPERPLLPSRRCKHPQRCTVGEWWSAQSK